jgi:O-acetyl-ADP-ribose deacetylase
MLRATTLVDGLPTGSAVATTAGRLPARHVIHTVGPVWSADEDRSALLASAYRQSLRVAQAVGARSVAFPAISAGVYDWPMTDAARIAVSAVRTYVSASAGSLELVRFVLFSDAALTAFEEALERR